MEKRNTVQRQLVLGAVRALHPAHPNAEQVYTAVTSQHPSISKATVYRNLNSLADDGELSKLAMPFEADRFDDIVGAHYHLHCVRCGKVVDLPLDYLADLNARAEKDSGCRVVAHNLIFSGICGMCAEDKKG